MLNNEKIKEAAEAVPVLRRAAREEELVWINPDLTEFATAKPELELTMDDIEDAERRLERFAPFIMKCFPETKPRNGLIESVLTPIPECRSAERSVSQSSAGKALFKTGQPSGYCRFSEGQRRYI